MVRRLGHWPMPSDWDARRAGRRLASLAEAGAAPPTASADLLQARLRRADRRRPRTLVSEATGLRSRARAGPGQGHRPRRLGRAPTSRSFQRLLGPALERAAARPRGAKLGGCRPLAVAAGPWPGPSSAWCSAGMSTRVLGQYDLLHQRRGARGPGPRLLRRARTSWPLEKRYGFAPQRVPAVAGPARGDPPAASSPACRGCATTSSAWSSELLGAARRPTRRGFAEAVRRRGRRRSGPARNPLGDGGVLGLVATPEQRRALLDRIQG